MPTARARYAITETPAISRALEAARRKWPEDSTRPSRLILRLVEEGVQSIEPELEQRRQERLRAIRELAGTGSYPPGYLEELRSDWPE